MICIKEILQLLGIDDGGEYTLYEAAKSNDNRPPRIIHKSKADWDIIAEAPETDDTLM